MSAVLSPCGSYRYRLEREMVPAILDLAKPGPLLGKVVMFVGINPSTADATLNDATVRKWMGFCHRWGVPRFIVGNVWPLRSTDVRVLATSVRWLDVGRENTRRILEMAAEADVLVPCWGDRAKVPRVMHNELDAMLSLLVGTGKPVMHFGLTKGGDPKHPLMLGYDTKLVQWRSTPDGGKGDNHG